MNSKLIVFDLDGTLVESAPEIAAAVNDVMRDRGWPPVAEACVEQWIGRGAYALMLRVVSEASGRAIDTLDGSQEMEEILGRFIGHYLERCGTCSRLYPHVTETLDALQGRGVRMVIATNKPAAHTERVLAAHGLSDAFEQVLCGDTMPARKPDPRGVTECLAALGVGSGQALFVGDSSVDVATARAVGLPVWLVDYGYNLGKPVSEAGADRVIGSIGELIHECG